MSCVRCGGKAFYTRRYSGEVLCGPCFQGSIVEKTRKTISHYGMLSFGEKVGVAVSGGKDSLSLLHVLQTLAKTKQYELTVLTVDEGVRGYREESIEHSAALVKDFGLRQVIVSYKELYGFDLDHALAWKDEREISSCSMCGVFRRRAIDEAAVRAGVSVIATAHNLDDYVQTFMMNLLHGDVDRIGWTHPQWVEEEAPLRRVKPFMEIYEEEIALYAHLSGLPFQSVSCPYMHEGLRSEVRDYLNEMESKHPGMKNTLLRSSLALTSSLGQDVTKTRSRCTRCGMISSGPVCSVCRMKELVEEHTKYSRE